MSLEFQALERTLERLLNDANYSQFSARLQNSREKLNALRKDYEHVSSDSPQIHHITKAFHNIGEEVEAIKERVNQIEFVNRLNEIVFITNIHGPRYLLLSAPMGYGKTRLLEAVKNQLQKQDCFCLYVELSRSSTYSLDDIAEKILQRIGGKPFHEIKRTKPEELGQEVGKEIIKERGKTQRNVIILLDETESFDKKMVLEFSDEFVGGIQTVLMNAGIRFRVILAGCYISHWSELPGLRLPLTSMSLTPFEFSAVYETVNRFDSMHNFGVPATSIREFASHLMYFTGGHPKCMIKILNDDFGSPIGSRGEKYYQNIATPIIHKIKSYIPEELENIFETLSVVRRFNPRLLLRFIDKKMINWTGRDEMHLETSLLKTFLVSKKGGFLYDDITRRIFAIHLRRTDIDRYLMVCKESIDFYEDELKSLKSHAPVTLAVELLFQKLQYFVYAQKGNKKQFLESIAEVLDPLISGRYTQEIMEAFIERLHGDWEFRFNYNYLLREEIYDDSRLFNELLEKITRFKQGL